MPPIAAESPLLVNAPTGAGILEAIVIMDAHLRVLSVNEAYRVITGFSEEDVLGGLPPGLDPQELSGEDARGLWEAIRRGERWQGELSGRRRSGERYPQRLSLDRVLGPERCVTGFVAIFSDRSARERDAAGSLFRVRLP